VKSNGVVTRIRHSEYFASVESTGTAFACASYPLNPGVASVFPWLSQVAQRYETYKFREVSFHYHTRAATTQVGTVGIVFDFDAQDPAPSSQMEALSYHDKVADSCWREQSLKLDLVQGDKLPTRYTRAGLLATPYDLKTLDLGNVHVFTDGVAASTNLGLLEVCYIVDLFTPQIENGVGGTLVGSVGLDATHLFGTTYTVNSEANLPFTVTSSGVVTFNQCWEGLVLLELAGTGLAADVAPVVAGTGSSSADLAMTVNAAATGVIDGFKLRVRPGATMTPTVTATTVTSAKWSFGGGAFVSYTP
jgi:hypothetical protein